MIGAKELYSLVGAYGKNINASLKCFIQTSLS